MLTPHRQKKLDVLFQPSVLKSLKSHGVQLSDAQQKHYKKECKSIYQAESTAISFGRKSKKDMRLPYTLVFLDDDPCILMPSPAEWKKAKKEGKATSNAAPKTLVSLTTGAMKFMKVYRPKKLGATYPGEYSLKEYENLIRLNEPVKYADRDTPLGKKFSIVTDYHPGLNLDQLMHDRSARPSHMLEAFTQACYQVQGWHAKGLIHLDLKPSNILFDTKTNKAKVIDFETLSDNHVKITGCCGTDSYAHPSVLKAVKNHETIEYTKANDIWAILEMAVELFTWMGSREKDPFLRRLLYHYIPIFEDQAKYLAMSPPQARPLQELPSIEQIIQTLHRAADHYHSGLHSEESQQPELLEAPNSYIKAKNHP